MGVEVETSLEGDGQTYPKPGDTVRMHYTARLATTGQKIDSTHDRRGAVGQVHHDRQRRRLERVQAWGILLRFQVGVNQVIRGWDEGVQKISKGEQATLRVTSDYAYGTLGAGGSVPPNADLIFEVELVDVAAF
eukprot:TRINITY_DN8902_c0_g1_i6.p2 TRINITY_DN8902_c0_g1~~TRINITY_DN8902_c0_g1_i6.p2  ORF type:complete len:148 (-),score=20.94 TRINITY_DN8902_c0_g1_i6:111-512(-)